jgi:hypothetical protein
MAKLTAWLMTLVGALWVLALGGVWGSLTEGAASWLIGLSFLVIGVSKLMRNYGKRK